MGGSIVAGVRGAVTKTAVAAALVAAIPGVAAGPASASSGVAFSADAPTGPLDP